MGWLFWNLMAHPPLGEKDSSSHFEPQGKSPFRKSAKAPKILGEAARARTMTPLFVLLFTQLVVLASSTSGNQYF
jgi:hypothetical protein